MITGIEIAGLILALVPLISPALKAYQSGFETLKDATRIH